MNDALRGLDFRPFDADNHYYEALDAFTRHVPKTMQSRCVQWADIDGRKQHLVGGRLSRAVSNPTFTPIAKPGALYEYFRGNPAQKTTAEYLVDREPIPAEYRDRDARLAKLDEQMLEACWMFPTLGVLYEELLAHDIEALTTTFTAFNRWLDEDWGCNYADRIYAAPYITLADCDWACRELEWAIDRDARCIVMRPSAPITADGARRVSAPEFDPFWARVAEAGITTVIHAGANGFSANGYARDGFDAAAFDDDRAPTIKLFHIARAANDFLVTLAFDKLFERFPRVRVASVENGSEFLPTLFKQLANIHRRMPGWFAEDPVALFREHVWINPFWEDDPLDTAALMGADRILFGSDWPHIEGLVQPLDYLPELDRFDPAERRLVLHDNARSLTNPT